MEQQELTNKVFVTMKHFASFMGNDYGVTDVWVNGSEVIVQRRELMMSLDIVYDVWHDGYVVRDTCYVLNSATINFLNATSEDFYRLRDIAYEVEKNEHRVAKNIRQVQ